MDHQKEMPQITPPGQPTGLKRSLSREMGITSIDVVLGIAFSRQKICPCIYLLAPSIDLTL
jgi:hypothetical protein